MDGNLLGIEFKFYFPFLIKFNNLNTNFKRKIILFLKLKLIKKLLKEINLNFII